MNKSAIALLLLCLVTTLPASGWELLSTRSLLESSDLVVIGKLVSVEEGAGSGGDSDLGRIEPYEVLKGTLPPGGDVLLAFPAKRRAEKALRAKAPDPRELLRYARGVEACFLLKRAAGSRTYLADHPARVKPYPFWDELRAEAARLAHP